MTSIDIFERCIEKAPLATATRLLLEQSFAPQVLDDLFNRTAEEQYTRRVLFSDMVALMGTIVQRMHRSVHAAFTKSQLPSKISMTSFYAKLNGIEPIVSAAFVSDHALRMKVISDQLQAPLPALIKGYSSRIIDGNAIAASEHRLEVLRDLRSGPLPGKSLVILDFERDLVTNIIPCEDGHAQERSLFDALLSQVHEGELWIADRNFCTTGLLTGIDKRKAAFLIREHRGIPLTENDPFEIIFQEEKMVLKEQNVSIASSSGTITARRIWLTLPRPTRDGDREIVILTTVPKDVADAQRIMDTYRKRWTIETMFANLTLSLRCEVPGLGHPRAALFAFATALVAANTLSTIRTAIRAQHGIDVEERVSIYQMVDDLQGTYKGLAFFDDLIDWKRYTNLPTSEFTELFSAVIQKIDIRRYPKAKKQKRRSKHVRGSAEDPPHVSTFRLLEEKKRKKQEQAGK